MGALVASSSVWRPLPGSQTLGIACPCNHILMHGTRGGGKSEVQLMAFRKHVGKGYGAFWRGIIFDREYKNLDDLVAKSKKLFLAFNDGARFIASKGEYKWIWPTGEELLFRVCKRPSDYNAFHGHEYPFIGWNEITKYPTSELYDSMLSCNRSSFLPHKHSPPGRLLPQIPLVVFSTTNPYGAGHNWVKLRFIDVANNGQVVRRSVSVYNPQTQQRETVVITQVAIFSSYKENYYLSPQYIAQLESIRDPNKRAAWLWGDWNVASGSALDGLWLSKIVVPRFKVPSPWYVDRTLDWGSSHPCSIGFWAEANGEAATLPDGSTFAPKPGSLVRISDLYLCTEIGENKGLKLGAGEVADRVLAHADDLRANGWVTSDIYPGPGDNSIGDADAIDQDSIGQLMAARGVRWTASNKSPGSRAIGLQVMRDRLANAERGEGPAIYFMDNCRASIAILPNLPRDEKKPDDVDTDAEDHIWDETRYRLLAGSNRLPTHIDVVYPT